MSIPDMQVSTNCVFKAGYRFIAMCTGMKCLLASTSNLQQNACVHINSTTRNTSRFSMNQIRKFGKYSNEMLLFNKLCLLTPCYYYNVIIQLTPHWGFSVTDYIKYYAYLYVTYLALLSLKTIYLHINCHYFLNCVYLKPHCQLSLWEETGTPGENSRLSAER